MEDLGAEDPRWIGEYRLLRRLGAGGMGRVFLAHSARGRTVAVKLVQTELAQQPEFRRRFKQEVKAAQRVGGEWTAPVLDADTEAATPWVATGYIAGPSLHAVIAEGGRPLPERSVRILGNGLTRALQDIHGAGLIHRDLKPSNILITIDGPRVIDFGIARALETVTDGIMTRSGAVVGSPGFMSPEQVRGERVTPASDIFCLGSVLAFAAIGRQPFAAATSGVHAVMYRIAQEEADLTGLPEGLLDLVTDCLAKDPEARPTLDELLERTATPEDEEVDPGEPWLPGSLVAQLGRHAVELLDAESPAAPAHPGVPAPPAAPPTAGGGTVPLPPTTPPGAGATPPPPSAPATPPPPSAAPSASAPATPPPPTVPPPPAAPATPAAPTSYPLTPPAAPATPPHPRTPPSGAPLTTPAAGQATPQGGTPATPAAPAAATPHPPPSGAPMAQPATPPAGAPAAHAAPPAAPVAQPATPAASPGAPAGAATPHGLAHTPSGQPVPGTPNTPAGPATPPAAVGGGTPAAAHGAPAGPPAPHTPQAPQAPRAPSAAGSATPAAAVPAGATPAGTASAGEPVSTPPPGFGPPAMASFAASGGEGHTPPGGSTPLGPVVGGPTPPAPPAKRRKRTALIVTAAAVATLLVAGVAAVAVLRGNDKDKDDQAKPKDKTSASAGPATGDPKSPATPSASSSPSDAATRPATTGDVPQGYLGAWEGEIYENDEPTGKVRRIVLAQGTIGSQVADTLTSADESFCQGAGTLKSVESLLVIDTDVTTSVPEGSCSPIGEQTLKLRDDGSIAWSRKDDSGEATLRRVAQDDTPIPDAYLGTWQAKDAYGEKNATLKLVIKQGVHGTPVAETSWQSDKADCEGNMRLVSVTADGLRLSTEEVVKETPVDSCTPEEAHTFTTAGANKLRFQYVDSNTSETGTVTFTRLD
ncbi:serine/threonine-protein kinase [Streptomyces sp. SAJ15]|uniref:serine/threonine-protein kinase n=1 Tax=Streptomyces sp. SAJ15 TaxID=2011095 RepID=UPI001185925C|nr:serine/threonine-protein kinase [Streptomyces sp. SAJ15]